jgi:uncharacterized RDD family membrane protein YckC
MSDQTTPEPATSEAGAFEPAAPPPPPPAWVAPTTPLAPTGHGGSGTVQLPAGVELASAGRRIGAYFLSIPLAIVTLGIGYFIWGAIVWGKGTSPALQVLGMKAWRPATQTRATWGTMALRNIIGGFVQGLFGVMLLVSFIMFLSDDRRRTIADRIGDTLIVHDPAKVLD